MISKKVATVLLIIAALLGLADLFFYFNDSTEIIEIESPKLLRWITAPVFFIALIYAIWTHRKTEVK